MIFRRLALSTVFAGVSILSWMEPAYAYLDPGTGSMVVQSILGVIAGGVMVIGIYWNKIKTFFFSKKMQNKKDDEA